jgi:hypothetical protein
MKAYPIGTPMATVAHEVKALARRGVINEDIAQLQGMTPDAHGYTAWIRVTHVDAATDVLTAIIFSRDEGHHTSGWFKNPDYERCWHLSLSFWAIMPPGVAPVLRPIHTQPELTQRWLKLFFGEAQRYLWVESPKSDEGKRADVWHYRVFVDELWRPIIPRGEVYSTELTERGWRSWSEVHAK